MTLAAAGLLPHEPPMRLLDNIVQHDDHSVWATAPVCQAEGFIGQHGLGAQFGLEVLAQAAAAFFTLAAGGGAPRQGMLIACPAFTSSVPSFPPDALLLVYARLASRLPDPEQGAALVKFAGELWIVDPQVSQTQLLAQSQKQAAVCNAMLSVYI